MSYIPVTTLLDSEHCSVYKIFSSDSPNTYMLSKKNDETKCQKTFLYLNVVIRIENRSQLPLEIDVMSNHVNLVENSVRLLRKIEMSHLVKFKTRYFAYSKKLERSKGFKIKTEKNKFSVVNENGNIQITTEALCKTEAEVKNTQVSIRYTPYGVKVSEICAEDSDTEDAGTPTVSFIAQFTKRCVGTMTDDDHAKEISSTAGEGAARYGAPVCKICYDNMVDQVYLPCGHCVSCSRCHKRMKRVLCVVCKKRINNVNKLFF